MRELFVQHSRLHEVHLSAKQNSLKSLKNVDLSEGIHSTDTNKQLFERVKVFCSKVLNKEKVFSLVKYFHATEEQKEQKRLEIFHSIQVFRKLSKVLTEGAYFDRVNQF